MRTFAGQNQPFPKMMQYDNTDVRRRDRLMPEEQALRLLREGEYGYLSMADAGGEPYGLPISYVWDEAAGNVVYLHCAPEGRKLRVLAERPDVSFCVVGRTQVIPQRFTTAYESLVARARATVVADDDERWHAVQLILQKYSPQHVALGSQYARASLPRTAIIRLDLLSLSGKRKVVGQPAPADPTK